MSEIMQEIRPLPVGSAGKRAGGWWGMWVLIVTEASLFGYLLFSYFYLASQTPQHWPPEGLPQMGIPVLNTAILLASSAFVWAGERCIRRNRLHCSLAAMTTAILLGAGFVMIQFGEWDKKSFDMTTNLYDSLYFMITGFHLLHVVVGLVILLLLLLWTGLGYFDHRRYSAMSIGGLYWHFVDAVWLFVFSALYLSPYVF
jgi:cytochrome c oxidase subunit 3